MRKNSHDPAREGGQMKREDIQAATKWKVRLEFKPQDLWVGVFWKKGGERGFDSENINIWICILPMVPIHIMKFTKYFTPGEKP